MNAKQFGQQIKAARRAKNWTRQQLSDKTGVRAFSIYCIEESGRANNYRAEIRQKLTNALGLDVELDK
jgi:transcriptional regulator with XRE-family HTH domain